MLRHLKVEQNYCNRENNLTLRSSNISMVRWIGISSNREEQMRLERTKDGKWDEQVEWQGSWSVNISHEVSKFLSVRRERFFHIPGSKDAPKFCSLIPGGMRETWLKFGQLGLVGILFRLVPGHQQFSWLLTRTVHVWPCCR